MTNKSQGFTLIEMAVVLVIMGILVGGLLTSFSKRTDQQRIELTQRRLDKIKEALLGYAVTYGRLPCPAENLNGTEATRTVSNVCDTYDNVDSYLPWVTLGVEQADAWGRPFRYRVDGAFSDNKIVTFATERGLQVTDRLGKELNISDDATYLSNIVAIVFSCGKNGRPDEDNDADGTLNTDAVCQNLANAPKDYYVQDVYVENQFDDILVWLPKSLLINRLVASGSWQN